MPGTETRALFPHLSPPLLPLYIVTSHSLCPCFGLPSSLSITSLFRNASFTVWLSCCRVMLHTGPPPGLRNTPTTCQPSSYMSSCFPEPLLQNKVAWSQVSRREPGEVHHSAKMVHLWLFGTAGWLVHCFGADFII